MSSALLDRLELLRPQDLERVRQLEIISTSRPWGIDAVREELEHAASRCFGLVAAPESAGPKADRSALVAWMALREQADECWLFQIVVDPEQRRRGLARALLGYAAKDLWNPAQPFYLEVRAGNAPARALYASLGFIELATRPRYYPSWERDGPREDAILMRHPRGP